MLTLGQLSNLETCQRCDGLEIFKSAAICRDLTEHRGLVTMLPIKSGLCPRDKLVLLDADAPFMEVIDDTWGPKKWAELHTMVDPTPSKLKAFIGSLPCADNCGVKFHAWVANNPPDLTPAGWFPWTVRAHNAVNVSLGKSDITVEKARIRWLVPVQPDDTKSAV